MKDRKPPVATVEHGRDAVLACLLVREAVYQQEAGDDEGTAGITRRPGSVPLTSGCHSVRVVYFLPHPHPRAAAMCARITITTTGTEIADLFGLSYDMSHPRPLQRRPATTSRRPRSFPVMRVMNGRRELADLRWGLIPHWNTQPQAHRVRQRPRRDRAGQARVPRPVPVAAVPRPGRRVLRVEDRRARRSGRTSSARPAAGCSSTRACGTGGRAPTGRSKRSRC